MTHKDPFANIPLPDYLEKPAAAPPPAAAPVGAPVGGGSRAALHGSVAKVGRHGNFVGYSMDMIMPPHELPPEAVVKRYFDMTDKFLYGMLRAGRSGVTVGEASQDGVFNSANFRSRLSEIRTGKVLADKLRRDDFFYVLEYGDHENQRFKRWFVRDSAANIILEHLWERVGKEAK